MSVGKLNPWWMVAAGALGTGVGAGIFAVYAFSVFIGPISAALGWDRSVLAACITTFMFSAGLGTVWLGRLISRFGLRRPTIIFLLVFAASIAAIALLPASKPLFFLNFFVMGIAGAAACAMPYSIAICGFFDRHRGLALGIAVLGSGIGSTLAPQLSAHLLETIGWRDALLVFALIAATPAAAIALVLRTPPGTVVTAKDEVKASDRLYLRDRNFQLIALAVAGNSIAAVGIMTSLVPMATDRGVDLQVAATMLSIAGASSFAGRLIVGWLFDRIFAPYVGAAVFVLAAIGALLIGLGGSSSWAYIGAAFVGTCLGAEADLVSFLVSRYFGPATFSRVVGAVWVAWAWGGGIGTFLASRSFEWTGGYGLALGAFVALFLISAGLLIRLPPYKLGHGSLGGNEAAEGAH